MDINQNINNGRQPNRPFKPKFNFYWLYMMIGLFFIIMMFWNPSVSVREMPYSKLEQALRDGCVQKLDITLAKQRAIATIEPERVLKTRLGTSTGKGLHRRCVVPRG